MKPEDVKQFYGSVYAFRRDTGMSASTLTNWLKWGYVPMDSQCFIEQHSKGALKAEWRHSKKR